MGARVTTYTTNRYNNREMSPTERGSYGRPSDNHTTYLYQCGNILHSQFISVFCKLYVSKLAFY